MKNHDLDKALWENVANPNGWHRCMSLYGNITASGSLNCLIYVGLIYGKNIDNSLGKCMT